LTSSGIYIPESANKEKPYLYEVVSVGPGKGDIEMTVSVGDQVLCGQYSGDEVKYEDAEYKIVAMDYILAVVK
ncbi:co-chaperone GroES, partial [Candidatus Gracilibacteria bacterium]|nr:co-chaperone GroES [Candidatus Gracilibacteria bacterium]